MERARRLPSQTSYLPGYKASNIYTILYIIYHTLNFQTQRKGLDADFVVNADETGELQSGTMSWSEASVDKAHSACGRSGLEGEDKRARILALANEVVTKSLTLTETELVTAADTVTFTIGIACTAAGFMFQHPMCS